MEETEGDVSWRDSGARAWVTAAARMSLWLKAWILAAGLTFWGIMTLLWHRAYGGTWKDAFRGWQMHSPSATAWALSGVLLIPLLWFTFLSNSRLVKSDDKRCVALMLFAGAIGGLLALLRHLLH